MTGAVTPSRPLRVLMALNSADLRIGAVNDALDLGELARPSGVEVLLAGPLTPEFRAEAARRGLTTLEGESRTFSRGGLPLYLWDTARWMWRLRSLGIDAVHLNYAGYGPSLALAARLLGRPVVARPGPYLPDNRANAWIDAYTANCAAHAAEMLASPLADRVVVTGDLYRPGRIAATMEAQRPLPAKTPGRVRVVFLGQLVERKGLHVLVEAFAKAGGDGELLLVGGDWSLDGYPARIRALIAQFGLGARVHCENHRPDVGAILASADVFVMPSFSEARPRSIIEAMSLGVPVVASDVGGIPSIVTHDVTGVLAPPGDVDAWAAALTSVLTSEPRRRALGQAGRDYVERECRADVTTARYIAVYDRLRADALAR